jgi:predicted nucleic acid-binding protein
MDNLVVDSSVAIKWFITETYSQVARRILNDYQSGSINLLAPDLINAEIGNIVWKKQRFQGMNPQDSH